MHHCNEYNPKYAGTTYIYTTNYLQHTKNIIKNIGKYKKQNPQTNPNRSFKSKTEITPIPEKIIPYKPRANPTKQVVP